MHTATTAIYTLSLHDALPISGRTMFTGNAVKAWRHLAVSDEMYDEYFRKLAIHLVAHGEVDRKSTRLNSSHTVISYAVFCLKKKKYSTGTARPPGATTTDASA